MMIVNYCFCSCGQVGAGTEVTFLDLMKKSGLPNLKLYQPGVRKQEAKPWHLRITETFCFLVNFRFSKELQVLKDKELHQLTPESSALPFDGV